MNRAKRAIVNAIERLGYQISALDQPTPGFRRGLENLARRVAPATVIDCGVADGTGDLYRAFPRSRYLLIEANPAYRAAVVELASRLGGACELVFCGAARGRQTIHVYADARKTSRYGITRDMRVVEDIEVPVETLDALVEKHHLPAPYLVKLDVEGAELDVLAGAANVLARTVAVIAEVALTEKYVDGPQLADVVAGFRRVGFVAFDIFGGVPGPAGGLSQVDMVFVPEQSDLRACTPRPAVYA